MQLPPDHPVNRDAALRAVAGGIAELCPNATPGPVLRYVPGRRVATRVQTAGGAAVLKVFATPRARGNARRLRILATSRAAHLVPRDLGVDTSGHVGLISWQPGQTLHDLDDAAFVHACGAVGVALRELHDSETTLDRTWTVADECAQLERLAGAAMAERLVDRAAALAQVAGAPLVTAHRDVHPKQVVVADHRVRFIDLDDAANAPAALDVANFAAHVTHDYVTGRRNQRVVDWARNAFFAGYGPLEEPMDVWEWLSLTRLASLAVSRHGRPDWQARLLARAEGMVPA